MARRSRFIGRDDDARHLIDLVRSHPLVSVIGPGGIGKTRLVEEAIRSHFDDVAFCDLSLLPGGADERTVAGHLGFREPAAAAAALAGRARVVVLDNCEHVVDAVAVMVRELLDTGDVRVVCTSREVLGVDGEQVVLLGPLALSDGPDAEHAPEVELFLDRVASTGATWDRTARTVETVAAICARLDGLPLAIELAAARARALSPTDLLEHADHSLDLLRATGRRTDGRFDSVRAAFDVSFELLDDDERDLFVRLGVFAGPFDAAMAQAVATDLGADRVHTIDILTRLVDRSLVIADTSGGATQYRLLSLLREYACEALDDRGLRAAAHDRFAGAMAQTAEQFVAEAIEQWSPELLARITACYPNLAAAIDWCVTNDETPDRAFVMMLPLLSAVHQSRGLEVLALGTQLLGRWPSTSAPMRAEAIAILATAAVFAGDVDRGAELAHLALGDADHTVVTTMLAERALGFVARHRRDFAAAVQHFAAGEAAAEALHAGSFARELSALHASTVDLLGERDAALDLAEKVAAAAHATGDGVTEAWAHLIIGVVLLRAERWADARAHVESARSIAGSLSYPWWWGAILRTSATLAAREVAATGDARDGWSASADAWREAVEYAVREGSVGGLALTLRAAAVVAARHQRDDVVETLLDAVPHSTEITVLPELFPAEYDALVAGRVGGTPPRSLHEALARVRAVLDESVLRSAPATAAPGEPAAAGARPDDRAASATLRREGDTWSLTFAGRTARVRDMKGLHDLAVLVARPDVEVHCAELMGSGVVEHDAGPLIDDAARRAYQSRIVDLQRDVEQARADNDPVRAERAEAELDALVAQLAAAFGLGGRDRATGSTSERARTAVANRLRSAIRRVADAHPELGRHLQVAVRTGTWCTYRPDTAISWTVES